MSIQRLFAHFDTHTILPISPNTVRDQILELGVQDEIRFFFVDIEPGQLRGVLYKYLRRPRPYADPVLCANILIARDLPEEWQRVVATKELLHILDTDDFTAQSREAVSQLLVNFSVPQEMRQPTNSFYSDWVQLILALAILVPKDSREILRNLIAQDKINFEDAARIAHVPSEFMESILSDWFEQSVADILNNGLSTNSQG